MKTINELEFRDWKSKNTDPYGARIFSYAEDWAELLEKDIELHPEMSVQDVIVRFADQRSRQADHDGITGFMYGAAVSTLAQCWIHGDALRRWHNKEVQIGDEGDRANAEGGTLNPALLNIG